MRGRCSAGRKLKNDNMSGGGQQPPDRAQRFPIHVPIRYRIPRSQGWLVGSAENVSRSGVLFRTECIFELSATLDLRLEIPPPNKNDGVHAEVVCKGEVVRVEQAHDAEGSQDVAVAIHHNRLVQRRQSN